MRDLRRNAKRGKDRQAALRRKGRLEIGVDIPTPDEVSVILYHAPARWRPFIVTAIYTGLRASELRGLRWKDVRFETKEIHVRQRADRFNCIGAPTSAAGHRTVPFGKIVLNTLREWKLRCPHGGLVFPTATGKIVEHSNLIKASLVPACISAGLVTKTGKAKYTGLHTLRHFYASWCINRPEDGGLGLPPKNVQERLGHSRSRSRSTPTAIYSRAMTLRRSTTRKWRCSPAPRHRRDMRARRPMKTMIHSRPRTCW